MVCLFFLPRLKFRFSFEDFFPQGDDDLEFFLEFIEDFETDDNFLLVGIEQNPTIFTQSFLKKVNTFSKEANQLSYVQNVTDLTTIEIPRLSPFGFSVKPLIPDLNKDDFSLDSTQILSDPRWKYNLVSEDGKSLALVIKHDDHLGLEESTVLLKGVEALLKKNEINNYHFLGRVYFQHELAYMQIKEFIVSSSVSFVLVLIVLFLLFKQRNLIILSLGSILLGLLIFMGIMSMFGRELNAISVLYPVIMLIVGTSDVIHIVTKYIDELKKGHSVEHSMDITIKQIGLATLLTSLTTAVGFAALMTSRIQPVRDFGINSALGVIFAYIIVISFTLAVISYIPAEKLKQRTLNPIWNEFMLSVYRFTIKRKRFLIFASVALTLVFLYGISMVSTNYKIENSLPRKGRIIDDFKFFEDKYSGFRPLEFAINIGKDYKVSDLALIKNIDKLENKLKEYPGIRNVQSLNDIYKSIHMASAQNDPAFYTLPDDETLLGLIPLVDKVPNMITNILINKDQSRTRISSRIIDQGADKVKAIGEEIEIWAAANIDESMLTVRRTGTGFLIDKNAEYVRLSLIQGLILALVIISLLMVFLFKDIKMLLVALVPNIIPLLFAAALLGYLNIELEASISIVFAIVFGIAVDDSIHFLSKYKLTRKNYNTEDAIRITFLETGKAITFTTIVLFFGFLVMLFSVQPASTTIGLLISVTLFSAWVADLLILPLLLRFFYK